MQIARWGEITRRRVQLKRKAKFYTTKTQQQQKIKKEDQSNSHSIIQSLFSGVLCAVATLLIVVDSLLVPQIDTDRYRVHNFIPWSESS